MTLKSDSILAGYSGNKGAGDNKEDVEKLLPKEDDHEGTSGGTLGNAIVDENVLLEQQPYTYAKTLLIQEGRLKIQSLRVLNFVGFTFALSFSIVLTGAYPYLKELMPNEEEGTLLAKYGIVVSALPIGQFICSPIFGMIADRTGSIRCSCIIMSFVFTCSSILYATLSDISSEPQTRFYLMCLSRFCAGAFTANIGAIRGYLCQVTTKAERTKEVSILSGCQTAGFLFGPVLQAAFGKIGCSSLADTNTRYFVIDSYNVCGWITAFLGVVNIILFMPRIFTERRITPNNADVQNAPNNNQAVPDRIGIFACLLCLSIYFFNFVYMEAVGTPICLQQFGWTQSDTVIYFGIMIGVNGLFSFGYYFLISYLSAKGFQDRNLMIYVGVICLIIGRIVMFPIPGLPLPPPITKNANDSNVSVITANTKLLDKEIFEAPSNPLPITSWREDADEKQFVITTLKALTSIYEKKSLLSLSHNVACEDVSGQPGCGLEWCSYTPALHLAQLITSWWITTIGFAFSVPIAIAIISKMYGTGNQGLVMSLTVMFGSFSRFVGPFIVSYVYTSYGLYYATGSTLITLIVALVILGFSYGRLTPINQ